MIYLGGPASVSPSHLKAVVASPGYRYHLHLTETLPERIILT